MQQKIDDVTNRPASGVSNDSMFTSGVRRCKLHGVYTCIKHSCCKQARTGDKRVQEIPCLHTIKVQLYTQHLRKTSHVHIYMHPERPYKFLCIGCVQDSSCIHKLSWCPCTR